MTQISSDDVQNLARMSALELDSEQVTSLTKDITNILNYVEQLSELDTTDVAPTYQLNNLSNKWREDIVQPSLSSKELISLAPDSDDNQIKVPKVL